MEESEFASDFATSFLAWDDDDVAAAVAAAAAAASPYSPAPSDGLGNYIENDAKHQSMTHAPVPPVETGTQQATSYAAVHPYQHLLGAHMGLSQHPSAASAFSTVPLFMFHHPSGMTSSSEPSPASQGVPAQVAAAPRVHDDGGIKAPQLHPLGIQSSATCPPHIAGTLPAAFPNASFVSLMYNPMLQTTSGVHNPQLLAMLQTPPHLQHHQFSRQIQQQTQMQHYASIAPAPERQQQRQDQQLQQGDEGSSKHGNSCTTTTQPSSSTSVPSTRPSRRKNPGTTKSKGKSVPPFYLFDAPCELRTNFILSQKLHNLPIPDDTNAFHYGMAVNGFHPQLNAQANPIVPLSGALPAGAVRLIDGRSRRKGRTGKERNEREQKRAQKITELIDELRTSMESGGWEVEDKSKYHTLTRCADYMRHLIKTNEEKEEAVAKARADLQMKERKIEDKAQMEARSDPESVTSSLTALSSDSQTNSTKGYDKGRKRTVIDDNRDLKKMRRIESSEEEGSSDQGSRDGPTGNNISLGKMSSSVSDITDSNKGSSDGGGKKRFRGKSETTSSSSISSTAAVARGTSTERSEHGHADIVVRVRSSPPKLLSAPVSDNHLINKEATSLDEDFELDYQEVFLASNVPQLIATSAGRVVSCNDFFLKATGLSRNEVSKLTIFSIVQADKLSNLFEMVAMALRGSRRQAREQESEADASGEGTGSRASGNTTKESRESLEEAKLWDYSAITLPCVSFPNRHRTGKPHHPHPLFMTVTLMADEDPHRRFFYCILTDKPGTNGAIGSVTPDLLALLFAEQVDSNDTNAEPASARENGKHGKPVEARSNTRDDDENDEAEEEDDEEEEEDDDDLESDNEDDGDEDDIYQ